MVLVDHNLSFLDCAIRSLREDSRFEIVDCFLSGRLAVEKVETLCPDLVLMDMAMPDMNGLEATRRMKERVNPPRVVILSPFDDPELRAVAKDLNADAYVTKDKFHTHLFPAVMTLFQEGAECGA